MIPIFYFCLVIVIAAMAQVKYFTTWNYWIHAGLIGYTYLQSTDTYLTIFWSVHTLTCDFVLIGSHLIIGLSQQSIRDRFTKNWFIMPCHVLMHILPSVVCHTFYQPYLISMGNIYIWIMALAQFCFYQYFYNFMVVYRIKEWNLWK